MTRRNNLRKLFASFNDAQIACLAAELEEDSAHVARRMQEFIGGWSSEQKAQAAQASIHLFSD